MDVHSITVTGRVGTQPEEKAAGEQRVVTFRLAVNERKDQDPIWYTISSWDRNGEYVLKNVRKGDKLYIRGRPKVNVWNKKSGETMVTLEINSDEIKVMVGSAERGDAPIVDSDWS